MSEAEIMWTVILGIGALITITTPLIRLNGNITKLNIKLDNINSHDAVRDKRLDAHAKQLDEHEKIIAEHEIRLKHLED